MPRHAFVSKAQWRWAMAHWSKNPAKYAWARRWATTSKALGGGIPGAYYKALPARRGGPTATTIRKVV